MDNPSKWGEDHINKSLKQIDSETWLVGGLVIHRSPHPSDVATWNDDSDNSSYTLTVAPTPPPSSTTAPDSPHIKLVYEAGHCLAIWTIGNNVWCKASFEASKVIHQAFVGNRSFLFFQRLPGRTLDAAWPSLNVNAVKEMADWKGHVLGGVDGQNITEYYLDNFKRKDNKVPGPEEFLSAKLQATLELLGMDCSNLVFSVLTLGPESIIVEDEPKSGKIGICDFETSGYFPRSWIRTKYSVSGAMTLEFADDQHWLRREVAEELGANGFEDFAEVWSEWKRGVISPEP